MAVLLSSVVKHHMIADYYDAKLQVSQGRHGPPIAGAIGIGKLMSIIKGI